MNKTLLFYDYERCFEHYTQRIMNIRQAKIHGEVIVAKPVLLLAIIDGIDNGVFMGNNFLLNDELEKRYTTLMRLYAAGSRFDSPAPIYNPYWHLESDGFWHLTLNAERVEKSSTPSSAWLREHVVSARFDDDLWVLLQSREWRTKLRDYIIEHKLTDDGWTGKMAAEGLGLLAALLMVA